MNLEYKISLEYDCDRLRAYWENTLKEVKIVFIPLRYFPAYLCLGSVSLIIWGILEQNAEDSNILIGTGIFTSSISILLFFFYRPQQTKFLSSIQNKNLQKQWSEYYRQNYKVNIILTPQEFILKTNESEKALTWKAFKSLKEYSTGFIIEFCNGYRKFIPKSVFKESRELNDFKQYIDQVSNKTKF